MGLRAPCQGAGRLGAAERELGERQGLQSKQRSTGAKRSRSSPPSSRIRASAASGWPDSSRQAASAQPGPPPADGIVPPIIRPPTRALSSPASIAAARSPA